MAVEFAEVNTSRGSSERNAYMHAKFMEFGRFGVRQFNVIPEDGVST
jgi:hypothetical protein